MLAFKQNKTKQQINLKPLATTQPAKTSTSKAKTQPTPLPKQPAPTTLGGSNKKPMSLASGLVPAAPPKRPAAATARPSTLPSKDAKPKVSSHQSPVPGKPSPLLGPDPSHCCQALEPSRWNRGRRGRRLENLEGPQGICSLWRPFRLYLSLPCSEAVLHLLTFLFLSPSSSLLFLFEHLIAILAYSAYCRVLFLV